MVNLMNGGNAAQVGPLEELLNGLLEFQNWEVLLRIFVSLGLSVSLAATIAYHPRSYGKASTLEEVEQPKIFFLYALVGALVAEIVKLRPAMAFVIFGLGGLLRFRTDVGPARDTGRIILVTCVGLSSGLGAYVIAVLATAFGWVLIYVLEGRVAHRILIKGLEEETLAQAAAAYEAILVENGMQVLSQKKNFVKKQVSFVFRAPGKVEREQLDELFTKIPEKLRGAIDWETA